MNWWLSKWQWLILLCKESFHESFAQEIFQKITSSPVWGTILENFLCNWHSSKHDSFFTLLWKLTLQMLPRVSSVSVFLHQIYMLLLTWYRAPLWLSLRSVHLKSLVGTHKSSYFLSFPPIKVSRHEKNTFCTHRKSFFPPWPAFVLLLKSGNKWSDVKKLLVKNSSY